MTTAIVEAGSQVAGLIHAQCACCRQPQQLIGHPSLDATRLVCPVSRQVHLDRGDGVFEPEGRALDDQLAEAGPEVTSDRPQRTGPKSRILLERATFA